MEAQKERLSDNKSFVYLMLAQAVSNLGDWLDILAILALVALKWNATPTQLAFVMLSLAIPMAVLGPITGVFADRMERKTLMIVSDIVRALLVISLVWVTNIWQVYLIIILRGVFEAVFTPAKNGKLKELVLDEQMEKATTISTIIDQAAKIVGPMLSGVLISVTNISAAFYLDGASFIISALLLMLVKKGVPKSTDAAWEEKPGIFAELKEGLSFMRGVPILLFGTMMFTVAMLVLQIADSQLMIIFKEVPDVSTNLIGASMSASGLGMIVSAALLSQKQLKSPLGFMGLGCILIGFVYGIAGYGPYFAAKVWIWFPVLFFIGGSAAGMVFIPFQAGAQRRTPVELSGRVFGTISSVSTAAVIIGPLIGALLVTNFGVLAAFLIAGILLASIGLFALFAKRSIERKDELVTQGNGITQGTTTA